MHRIAKTLTKGPARRVLPHIARTSTRGYSSVEDGSGKGPARAFATQAAAEPFLSGSSSTYVEEMYLAWQADPSSVHKSWDSFFRQTAKGAPPGQAYVRPPTLTAGPTVPMPIPLHAVTQGAPVDEKTIEDHLSVQSIIRSYQIRGHHLADLDPLQINKGDLESSFPAELLLSHYQLGKRVQ